MKFMRTIGFLLALFGAVGFATSVQAAREADPKAKDLILKGDAKCTGCHDEGDEPIPSMLELHPSVLSIGKTKHGTRADGRTPTCTDCHGESDKHLNHKGKEKPPLPDRVFTKGTKTPAALRNEGCLSCHQKDTKRHFWAGSAHETNDVACVSCHNIHSQKDKVRDKYTQADVCYSCHKDKRAEGNRPSHHPVKEGKVTCSDCHNAHGSAGSKLLTRSNVNDTCYQCHMEKRGPFLHNHQPVNEDCTLCHNPHGSVAAPLLKARAPFLCHECHDEAGHPGQLGALPTTATSSTSKIGSVGRGCLNCHTSIHGDNNPQGATATRRFFR
jgi:DmsE family decaheme c-type cytochrome